MIQDAYMAGRELVSLAAPFGGRDKLFAADRIDGQVIERTAFEHCTFANVSFKEVTLDGVTFVNCVFLGCYFRRANIRSSQFKGCKFMDCAFPQVAISYCDFRYSVFRGCFVSFEELEHSLPTEPNLRLDLARNLAREAGTSGQVTEARPYRLTEIRASEEHLWAAFTGQTKWYREHFDAWRRAVALFRWIRSKLNGALWGYGENIGVLLRNYLILGFLVFPGLFFLMGDGLQTSAGTSVWLSSLFFSLELILPAGIESGVTAASLATRLLAGLESVLGVLFLGLLGAHVLRWSLRR